MSFSLAASSMMADPSVTTYKINTSHKKNETSSEAINLGNLDEESSNISISDQGSAAAGSVVSTTFTAAAGVTSLAESFNSTIQEAFTRFQLFDSSGKVIADSEGDQTQQTAFSNWQKGSLTLSAGKYTATATPNSLVGGSMSLSVTKSESQGTSLAVNSQLTGSDASEYYDFSLSGTNLKLNFDATTNAKDARVVVTNSSGKVVADSGGSSSQKADYIALTSGTGLAASSGDYSVKVTYAKGADTTKNLNYSMQLYTGNSYAVVYKTTATAQAYDNTAAGSVTAASNAELYTRTSYNKITTSALTAVNVGWLQQDKSMLDVYSQLTSIDSADYYSFTLQQGDNLKFGFNTSTTKDTSGIRVQLMNSTGTQVLADNYGTAAQQAVYKELTTTNGLASKAGGYVVKVSYAPGATKSSTNYEFGIYSGSTYAAEYKTTASAQTYGNAMLTGEVKGSSQATALAAYLTAQSNGDTTSSLSDALKAFI